MRWVRYSKPEGIYFLVRSDPDCNRMISRAYLRSVLSLHKTYFEKAKSATRVRGAKK